MVGVGFPMPRPYRFGNLVNSFPVVVVDCGGVENELSGVANKLIERVLNERVVNSVVNGFLCNSLDGWI
jgi:hypothetical protein